MSFYCLFLFSENMYLFKNDAANKDDRILRFQQYFASSCQVIACNVLQLLFEFI